MASHSAHEQLLLELINRARLDPKAEAERLGGLNLNAGLPAGTLNGDAKQPLAPNALLNDAADGHSRWMLEEDIFSHTGDGGSSAGDRIADAGYVFTGFSTWGENISRLGTSGSIDRTSFIERQHEGLFHSAGHRTNMLSDTFREAGVAAVEGSFTSGGSTLNTLMVTENFARSGTDVFLTGVAYADEDGDGFYSPGEGTGGITVSVDHPSSDVSTSTASAGGYAIAVAAGDIEVTFSGGGLARAVSVNLDMSERNIKLDLVDGRLVQASADIALGSNAYDLQLLGAGHIDGTGNDRGNKLYGGTGRNRLEGEGGKDRLNGGEGRDTLTGGSGDDRFDFDDTSESRKGGSKRDVITDFERGDDRIDLKGIDADEDRSGNQAFKWISNDRFSRDAGELRYKRSGDDLIVQADTDGDAKADLEIRVDDLGRLSKGDFVL